MSLVRRPLLAAALFALLFPAIARAQSSEINVTGKKAAYSLSDETGLVSQQPDLVPEPPPLPIAPQRSPSDQPSVLAPSYNVSGGDKYTCCDSCDSCCGCGFLSSWPCGCPLECLGEACKLWEPCCEDSPWSGAGWLAAGFVWNPYSPVDRFNGPMTWNDRAN
ncbi:MAG TPA: hypothetical protein VFB80_20945, partial [Pirellulaceae bacterium]|nr:hypothetical protein [Pirellulaceae bacterium]